MRAGANTRTPSTPHGPWHNHTSQHCGLVGGGHSQICDCGLPGPAILEAHIVVCLGAHCPVGAWKLHVHNPDWDGLATGSLLVEHNLADGKLTGASTLQTREGGGECMCENDGVGCLRGRRRDDGIITLTGWSDICSTPAPILVSAKSCLLAGDFMCEEVADTPAPILLSIKSPFLGVDGCTRNVASID